MENRGLIDQVITYIVVIVLAAFSGIVKSIRSFQKSGEIMTIKTLLAKSMGDIIISIFAGLMMFLWLQGEAFAPLTAKSAFYISIASYMGSQAIDVFVAAWNATHKGGVKK